MEAAMIVPITIGACATPAKLLRATARATAKRLTTTASSIEAIETPRWAGRGMFVVVITYIRRHRGCSSFTVFRIVIKSERSDPSS
jgi:hypothetical protein